MKSKLQFLSIKAVPLLRWSSKNPRTLTPPIAAIVYLLIGLVFIGLGEALLVVAGVGVSPWMVFAQGIANKTGWSIGFATFFASVVALICWVPLRQTPGIGTVLNAIVIALVIDLSLPYLPVFDSLLIRVPQVIFGILAIGFGTGLYLIANLGPGPRDGLMTGLQRVTDLPTVWVRSGIELTVVLIGWTLGGTVGLGTILFAFGIGPSVAASMYGLKNCFENSDAGD
ncbi:YczE/YyaS/YitT family protein [Maritalea sp.]|uniref:membrane protein YczE n=1 Tax=Maritalea sp. TaxID=2003361 RepID=UPI003EF8D74E